MGRPGGGEKAFLNAFCGLRIEAWLKSQNGAVLKGLIDSGRLDNFLVDLEDLLRGLLPVEFLLHSLAGRFRHPET